MCVFGLVCVCVCVWVCVCVCVWGFFMGLRCRPGGFLKGARQLSFTAPGGYKQRGRERYLPLLLGKKREVGALLRSNCNSTQLLDKRRNERKNNIKTWCMMKHLKVSNSSVLVTLAV